MKEVKEKNEAEEDEILVKKAQESPEAYEALYKKYGKRVYNYFWYRAGQVKEVAEDLAQETFVKAYQKLPNFRLRAYSYFSYLKTIAHNTLVKYYKKPKTASLEEIGDIAEESAPDKSEVKETAELLWQAIEKLPEAEKNIILLKYREGRSVKEIAELTKKSTNAIKLVLSRTRKKLVGWLKFKP
ncbi:MAG: hypothetical protein UW05_C0026G0012 [Candidatus Giovannonibacteria bacterium GW2011_GWC2_43_8]|nr:MAG: hypothetical protein UW05_C0026G0012 [Candidatus Giovannonibacteria bacterium GW2011_GWC2_43_8]